MSPAGTPRSRKEGSGIRGGDRRAGEVESG
jgi:hypothetical protein